MRIGAVSSPARGVSAAGARTNGRSCRAPNTLCSAGGSPPAATARCGRGRRPIRSRPFGRRGRCIAAANRTPIGSASPACRGLLVPDRPRQGSRLPPSAGRLDRRGGAESVIAKLLRSCRVKRPVVLFQDRVSQDAGEARQLGQRGFLYKIEVPQHCHDDDDYADDVEDAVHSRSPVEVAPHAVRIILSVPLERRVRCSKEDSSPKLSFIAYGAALRDAPSLLLGSTLPRATHDIPCAIWHSV